MAETITITETGCYLDNNRGHYITRDAIELAIGYGFIVGQFERFALDMYDDLGHVENYPFEALVDLCDEAVSWLNHGRDSYPDARWAGQNFPPIVPDDHYWSFYDGDFGLYAVDELD